ncbi:MAG: imidazole glycerol phosphate synthase subunit HisH [Bacillota bacterium]|nr:imidazole glycerol phosphate synthase subunit HisH [Bacillota bacterium]
MIIILDYGLGNVYNLKNAIEKIGCDAKISSKEEDILNADILFMPGVGAFKIAMQNLIEKDLISVLNKRKSLNYPIIGICLGMQILFDSSDENGFSKGLGFIKGHFSKFKTSLNVPHMGWNELIFKEDSFINYNLNKTSYGYYVHSFYLSDYDEDNIICYSQYDVKVPSIIKSNNIYGIQFHPEKSGKDGLNILKNFIIELGDENEYNTCN